MTRPTLDVRVTVGVPVYNGERYLPAAIDSLIAQTYPDFELIICDNASTDRTEEISRDYAASDPRVRYVRNEVNIGAGRNFIRAFELSSTEYFRWNSADDLSGPEFLARCVPVLDEHPDVVQVYPRTQLIDDEGKVFADYDDDLHVMDERPSVRYLQVTERLRLCNAIYGLIRSSDLKHTAVHGSYIGSDIPFQAELALYGKIWEIPERMYFRRMHREAQSAMTEDEQEQHYNPTNRRASDFRNWRHLWERVKSVQRAPIATGEKLRIHAALGRGAIRSRDDLAVELLSALRLARPGSTGR